MYWQKVTILVFIVIASVFGSCSLFTYTKVQFATLDNGGFRATYIPDQPEISKFKLSLKINNAATAIVKETNVRNNGLMVLDFDEDVRAGDHVVYDAQINCGGLRYIKGEQIWNVPDPQKSFTLETRIKCTEASTLINNGQNTCTGMFVIDEEFKGSSIDTSKWIIEHRIPTYEGPNFEFNTYENRNDVCFIKDGILYLKPKALEHEDEVRGIKDLIQGCTSDYYNECFYKQMSSFLIPPVVSAKIRSKVSFKYGKVDIRAKLPQGDWIYPILELEPKDKIDGENSTKIWIAYSRGNLELKGNGPDDYGSRLLFGGPVLHPEEPIRSKALATKLSETPFSDDFHLYTLEWSPGKISLYIDSQIYGDISTRKSFADTSIGLGAKWTNPEAPFDREYVLLLGTGVGGVIDFPDGFNSPNDPKPWLNEERDYIKNFFDARNVWLKTWKGDNPALQIDYVKVTAI